MTSQPRVLLAEVVSTLVTVAVLLLASPQTTDGRTVLERTRAGAQIPPAGWVEVSSGSERPSFTGAPRVPLIIALKRSNMARMHVRAASFCCIRLVVGRPPPAALPEAPLFLTHLLCL